MVAESFNQPNQSEIIKLGKKLVEELDPSDSVDTLGRWMAHYVAELINKAEQAQYKEEKETAERECYEVILKLWANRKDLPDHLQPLALLKPALSVLAALHQKELSTEDVFWGRTRYKKIDDPWGRFLHEIHDIFEKIFSICLNSSLTNEILEKEKIWLDEHENFLSEDEKNAIRSLNLDLQITRHTHNLRSYDPKEISFVEKSPEDRKLHILNSIESLIDVQKEKLNQLKKAISSNTPTPSIDGSIN